jgi:outer membrane lipoprotein-sorting protein
MRLMRYLVLAVILAAAAPKPGDAQPHAAVLTDADAAALHQAEGYLSSVRALKGHFLQIAPDGGTSTGTAWLVRPGRIRFQYDPPSPLLLVANNGLVVVRDSKLDSTETIPEGQTPLGLLMRDNLAFSGDVTVTDIRRPPGLLEITLVKTSAPGDGSLTLDLDDNPMALAGWSVVDAQGRQTRIKLSDVTLGGHYDGSLFASGDLNALSPNGNTP